MQGEELFLHLTRLHLAEFLHKVQIREGSKTTQNVKSGLYFE